MYGVPVHVYVYITGPRYICTSLLTIVAPMAR